PRGLRWSAALPVARRMRMVRPWRARPAAGGPAGAAPVVAPGVPLEPPPPHAASRPPAPTAAPTPSAPRRNSARVAPSPSSGRPSGLSRSSIDVIAPPPRSTVGYSLYVITTLTSRSRALQRGCGSGLRSLRGPGSRRRPHGGLRLKELVETVPTVLAAETALLVAPERRVGLERRVVDVDLAGAQPPGEALDALRVVGPDAGDEPVHGRVGDGQRLGLALVGQDREDRTEDLLLRDGHVRRHVAEDRRLHV